MQGLWSYGEAIATNPDLDAGFVPFPVFNDPGLEDDRAALDTAVSRFLDSNRFSASSAAELREAARDIYNLGEFKRLLAERWVEKKFELGVVGFTLHPISPPTRPELGNFAKAWTEMAFPRTLANTFLITFFGVAGILLFSSMAASLVLSATPIIVFYLALQKYIVKGIAAGAVKG